MGPNKRQVLWNALSFAPQNSLNNRESQRFTWLGKLCFLDLKKQSYNGKQNGKYWGTRLALDPYGISSTVFKLKATLMSCNCMLLAAILEIITWNNVFAHFISPSFFHCSGWSVGLEMQSLDLILCPESQGCIQMAWFSMLLSLQLWM